MPEVDFMVLADYVRGDQGVLHMIAAGVDRIAAASVPTAHNMGIAIRLKLTRAECDRRHEATLIFQTEDGSRLLELNAAFVAPYPPDLPPGWPSYGVLALNVGIPIPQYGIYSFELLIDGQSKKSIPVHVYRPDPASRGGDAAAFD